MAVILNTTVPSSSIKKKHQSCSYHKVRENIAKFVRFQHIKSEDNMADLFTKPLRHALYDKLTAQYLLRRPKTVTGSNVDKEITKEQSIKVKNIIQKEKK